MNMGGQNHLYFRYPGCIFDKVSPISRLWDEENEKYKNKRARLYWVPGKYKLRKKIFQWKKNEYKTCIPWFAEVPCAFCCRALVSGKALSHSLVQFQPKHFSDWGSWLCTGKSEFSWNGDPFLPGAGPRAAACFSRKTVVYSQARMSWFRPKSAQPKRFWLLATSGRCPGRSKETSLLWCMPSSA